jgi:glutaredoxin
MPLVTLYTRRNCCLCDHAKAVLSAARSRARFDYEEVDIDTDPELLRLYNNDVPVVAIDRVKVFQHQVDMKELLKRLEVRA